MLANSASIVTALAVLGLDADGVWSTSLGATVARARPAKQAPDGATLKSTAPIPQSPINNQSIGSVPTPALICTVATGRFVSSKFKHHFEVWAVAADGTSSEVGMSRSRSGWTNGNLGLIELASRGSERRDTRPAEAQIFMTRGQIVLT